MGARWYEGYVNHWIQPDTVVPNPADPQSLNRYAYVRGNPLKYADPSGHMHWAGEGGEPWWAAQYHAPAWMYEFTPEERRYVEEHVHQPEAWEYLAFYGGAVLVIGVSSWAPATTVVPQRAPEAATATVAALCLDGDCANEISAAQGFVKQGFGSLSRAAEYGIQTYDTMPKMIGGTDLEAHHIIESRFIRLGRLGLDFSKMPTVALTLPEHQAFTNAWRDAIDYISSRNDINTISATLEQVWAAAQVIYAEYPELLEAARQALFPGR